MITASLVLSGYWDVFSSVPLYVGSSVLAAAEIVVELFLVGELLFT